MPIKVATAPLLFALLAPIAAPAAPSADWSRVQDLPQGRRVIVLKTGGEAVRGRLAGAGADAITVESSSGPVTIPRSDVSEVRKTRSRLVRGGQFGALGAGIGIGLAAVLLAATGGSDETGEIVMRGALIGGAIGFAGGAAASSGRTIYRAAAAAGQ